MKFNEPKITFDKNLDVKKTVPERGFEPWIEQGITYEEWISGKKDWRDKYVPKQGFHPLQLEDSADDSELNRMIQLKDFEQTTSIQGKPGRLYYDKANNQIKFFVNNTVGWINILTSGTNSVLTGDATSWKDELGDAVNLKSQGAGVAMDEIESVAAFIHTAQITDYLYTNVQLNHDRCLTSSIYPHIHFFQAENAVPNFVLRYRWQINGGTKVTEWTYLKCNTLAFPYLSGTIHQIAYSSPIPVPAGTTLSDIIQFRIIRDHDNASNSFTGQDPYTATVGVLSFDIHYVVDGFGSNDEYAK